MRCLLMVVFSPSWLIRSSGRANPENLGRRLAGVLEVMTLVGDQIKGFPFFGFITLISDMDCDRSGKDIAKFLSLMRKIHIGGAAGPQSGGWVP